MRTEPRLRLGQGAPLSLMVLLDELSIVKGGADFSLSKLEPSLRLVASLQIIIHFRIEIFIWFSSKGYRSYINVIYTI